MEIEIKNSGENKVIGRKEIAFSVKFEQVVPNRGQVREKLVAALSCDPKLLVIKSIMPVYGTRTAKGTAHLYGSEKDLKLEHRHLLVRDKLMEKKQKVAKASAPAKKKE